MEGNAVEGQVSSVSSVEEVPQALNEMKTGKAPGPLEVSLELIVAMGGAGIQVMAEICQKVLDGFGMPVEFCSKYSGSNLQGKMDGTVAAIEL